MVSIRVGFIAFFCFVSALLVGQTADRNKLFQTLNLVDSLLSSDQDSLAKVYLDVVEPDKDRDVEIFLNYYVLLGDYYLNVSLYKESAAAYKKLLTINSRDLDRESSLKLAKAINDMGIALQRTGKAWEAIDAHIKSQEIYERYNEPIGGSYNYNNIAIIYTELKKIDSALYFHEKSLEYAKLAYDTMGIGFNHLNMAILHADNNDLVKSLFHFQQSLKIFEQQRNERMINALKRRMAAFYLRIKDYETALGLIEGVFDYYQERNSSTGLGGTHVTIGEIFMSMDQLDTALFHLNKGIEYYKPSGYAVGLAKAYVIKGKYFRLKGDFDSSIKSYEESLKYSKGAFKGMSMNALNGMAKVYLELKNYPAAIRAALNGLDEGNYSASPGNMASSYETLYKSYKALGDHKKSLEYLEKYNDEKDKIFDDDQMIKLARIEYQNQLEREEVERSVAEAEKDLLASQELARERWIGYTAMGAGVLILLIAVFVYRAYRIKRSANEQLNLKNAELQRLRESEQNLAEEALSARERELATMAMASLEKNNLLAELSQKVSFLETRLSDDLKPSLKEMRKTISSSISLDNTWDSFIHRFEDVHPQFFGRLKSENPNLTINDLKLSAYLKIGMSNKEIANVTHLTVGSVKSGINRLKKKLNLGPDDSIRGYMLEYA